MTADQPARPANIANIVAINQGHRPLTMGAPASRDLSAADVAALQARGHLLIDTRRSAAFSAGYVPGALNVQLASPEFEQRVGWVAPPDVPLVLVHDDDEEAAVAVRALAFVGLDSRVAGHLAGGVAAWVASGRALDTLEQLDVHVLHARLSGPRAPRVVDVREPSEWRAGHIAGAQQLSYRVLAGRAHELGAAADEPIAVVCHGGGRSSTACSLLRRAGFSNVVNVSGGMQAWQATGLPIETGMGCAADVDPSVGPSR